MCRTACRVYSVQPSEPTRDPAKKRRDSLLKIRRLRRTPQQQFRAAVYLLWDSGRSTYETFCWIDVVIVRFTGLGRNRDCCCARKVRGGAPAEDLGDWTGVHQARESWGGARENGKCICAGDEAGEMAHSLSGGGIAFGQVTDAVSHRLRLVCGVGKRPDCRAEERSVECRPRTRLGWRW